MKLKIVNGSAPYVVEDGKIYARGREAKTPLCNFAARIAKESVVDDGETTKRVFHVKGTTESGRELPVAAVPADQFGRMAWVLDKWGSAARVVAGPGIKDKLRDAIQALSDPRVEHVFAHTGWRCVDGEWLYLTASGAVGDPAVKVGLPDELQEIRLPTTPSDSVQAVRKSLAILELAPKRVTVPMLAAVYRAPLVEAYSCDLSIWMSGLSGSFKSTLAALAQSHWGRFTQSNLPGSWSSTDNSLEHRAFVLKDVLFVIDDYAPTAFNRREMQQKVSRIIRAQGNLSGRSRLSADSTALRTFRPRGVILGTGEQNPGEPSILARMIVVQVDCESVDVERLTDLQRCADLLPHAMAGFIQWLAGRMAELKRRLSTEFDRLRTQASEVAHHPRLPSAVANLFLGIEYLLTYAEEIDAITADECSRLRGECWDALVQCASATQELFGEERPSEGYFRILVSLVQEGSFVIENRRPGTACGASAGTAWIDSEYLYLGPEATFRAISRAVEGMGERFNLSERELRHDLMREGLLSPDPGRRTASVRIGSSQRRVLRFAIRRLRERFGDDLVDMLLGNTVVTGFTGTDG